MKQIRFWYAPAVVISALLLLAGCSGSGNEPSSTVAPAASSSSKPGTSGVATASSVAPVLQPSGQMNNQFVADSSVRSLSGLATIGVCSLEDVVTVSDGAKNPGDVPNSYKVKVSGSYTLIGFATDVEGDSVPKKIKLVLSGPSEAFSVNAITGLGRPDVAKYFKKPGLINAGYQLNVAFGQVPTGTYQVNIVDLESSKVCPTHQTLEVD